ncbi:hypothetical protein Taro_014442 [Colocasia esculenta]|uniref:Uncharacterized protein n=1 Tax=Colocasia esculenta TaxID=4460 RepID=A0A843UI73_COLES|nr:hypothetical protein [Colocasia esculenta]
MPWFRGGARPHLELEQAAQMGLLRNSLQGDAFLLVVVAVAVGAAVVAAGGVVSCWDFHRSSPVEIVPIALEVKGTPSF